MYHGKFCIDLFFLLISIHLKVNRIIPWGVMRFFTPRVCAYRWKDFGLVVVIMLFIFWTGCCYYAHLFLPVVAITPFFLLIFGLVVVIKLFFFFFFTGCCYYAFLVRTKRAQCRHSFLFSRASPSFLRRSRKYTGCALAFHNDVNEYEKVSFDFYFDNFFSAKYLTFPRITNKDNRTHEHWTNVNAWIMETWL